MSPSVQTMIEQANNRSKAANRKVYVKKATDLQYLENMTKQLRVSMDIYHQSIKEGLHPNNNMRPQCVNWKRP